ncbi:MAG: carboxypeptidase-like regulatory domain-containing protein [Acidobacteriota bacterium]
MKHHFTVMLRFLSLAVVLLYGVSGVAFAQEVTGSIVGTVSDAAGGAVQGANVTITDAEKKVVVRNVTTNETGEFSVPNLTPGTYDVTIEAPNFKKHVEAGVKVDVGARQPVTVALVAGNIAETVTVDASPVAVELTTPTVSNVINGDQARELSLNTRNWVQLVTLAPGVSNDLNDQVYVGTTNPDTGTVVTQAIGVNGARSSQNTFTVDGADVTDRGSNITIQAYPSIDSIGEFRVLQSLFPAESGRSGGGQVNIVTRSGGANFHGSAFEFIRNEAFNANYFLINSATNPPFGRDSNGKAKRPPFRYNNWGWTLSGPIYLPSFGEDDSPVRKLKRTFFFYSEEFRKDRRFTSPATVTVPDANLRLGIFPIPVCINRPVLGETACTGSFILPAGTPIPLSFRSPAAQAYVSGVYNRLPLPNQVSPAAPYNLLTSFPNVADFRQEILKFDHSFSDNWSGYYRYQHDNIPTIDANAIFGSGSGLPGVSTLQTNSPGKTHTLQTTYVISPKTILEGRYAYGYGAILSSNIGLLALTNTSVPVSLPFQNTRDRIPSVSANGFTGLGSFGPYDNFSYKHNFNGTLTQILGSHTVKYGGVYSIYRKNENALAGSNEGNFSAFPSVVATGAANTTLNQNIQRWASFLVGNVTTFTQAHFDYTADLRQKTIEGFVQDEWRARRNLTMYYGVRYSYFPPPWDKNGRLSNFDPALYNPAQAPQITGAGLRVVGTGNFCNGIIINAQNYTTGPSQFNCTPIASPYGKYVLKPQKKDFAPRFGLAWDPFGKGMTSVRMGYGIYHEQVLNGFNLTQIGTNPPYQETVTASNTRLDNPAAGFTVPTTPQGLRGVDTDWNTPYMQHWSLNIQHQLQAKTVVSVGYYGSKGTHLIGLTEINSIPAGKALNTLCARGTNFYAQTPAPVLGPCQTPGYAFRNVAGTAATGNPNVLGTTASLDVLILDQIRPFKGYRSVALVQPRYDSNYHSLQVSSEKRFTGASQVKLAYTWSKNLTTSINDRTTSPQNSYDIASEYQRAALDRRHVLNVNGVYELPFFKGQNGFQGKVLGGWQISGIATYNSGLPFTATTSNLDFAGLGIINTNPAARPNLLCDPNENAPHTVLQYFNTACFQLNPTATLGLPNTPGNTARGNINGPETKRVDFTLSKNTRIAESVRLQLRAEVFNIFNRTNFRSFVSTNVTSASFGQIGGFRDPRTMQFGAKLTF